PTTADVRVMTVHQAKGLEFDIVVLPELGSAMEKQGRTPVLTYREEPTGRVTAVLPAVRENLRVLFPELEDAHAQARQSSWRDEPRTRARYAVHSVAAPSTSRAARRPGTPAALIWAAVAGGPPPTDGRPGDTIRRTGASDWHLDPHATPHGTTAKPRPMSALPV